MIKLPTDKATRLSACSYPWSHGVQFRTLDWHSSQRRVINKSQRHIFSHWHALLDKCLHAVISRQTHTLTLHSHCDLLVIKDNFHNSIFFNCQSKRLYRHVCSENVLLRHWKTRTTTIFNSLICRIFLNWEIDNLLILK